MTDPLSVTASVVGIVSFGLILGKEVVTLYDAARNAGQDVRALCDSGTALSNTLEILDGILERDRGNAANIVRDHITACADGLRALDAKLRKVRRLGTDPMNLNLRLRLRYAFHQKTIEKLRAIIDNQLLGRLKLALIALHLDVSIATQGAVSTLTDEQAHIASSVDGLHENIRRNFERLDLGMRNISDDFQAERQATQREKIITWVASFDPVDRFHYTVCEQRQTNTGDWFLQKEDYKTWRTLENSLLWLNGIPGCGKTVLCSSIIQETALYCAVRDLHYLAYFYFSFSDNERQRTDTFLRSILRQLLLQRETVPDGIVDIYKMYQHRQPPTEIWKEGIKSVIQTFGQTFIIIDALDECPSYSGERARLLEVVKSVHGYNLSNLHILATSRREGDIDRILRPILETPPLSIQNAEVDGDIVVYVAAEIAKDEIMSKWSPMLQEEVRKELGSKAQGMFRWASCQIESLRTCLRASTVRKALKSLPPTLDETYNRMLLGISAGNRQEAINALSWLIGADRPLNLAELAEAIAINPDDDSLFDTEDRLFDPESLIAVLSGLVLVRHGDIRIAHFSVEEYLLSDRLKDSTAAEFYLSITQINLNLALAALRYLQSPCIQEEEKTETSQPPLLEYAAHHWVAQVRRCEASQQPDLAESIIAFLGCEDSRTLWESACLADRNDFLIEQGCHSRWTSKAQLARDKYLQERQKICPSPLYYASRLGLTEVMRKLLASEESNEETGSGENYGDELRAACFFQHFDAACLLLDAGADIEARGGSFKTGLGATMHTEKPDREIIRTLIRRRQRLDKNNSITGWVLRWAAMTNEVEIVREILSEMTSLPQKDGFVFTTIAGIQGKVSRGRGVFRGNCLAQGGSYTRDNSAPYEAACAGNLAVLEILVKRWDNINEMDGEGRTALYWAVFNMHEDVVGLLLQSGANCDQGVRSYFWTPFFWAEQKHHRAIQSLLLEAADECHSEIDLGRLRGFRAEWRELAGRESQLGIELEPEWFSAEY